MIHRVASRLPTGVRTALLPLWRRVRRAGASAEDEVVARLVGGADRGFAVDLAACDGISKSNTLALYERGWAGCAIEADPSRFSDLARTYRRFPEVALVRVWISPHNVSAVLRGSGAPPEPDFLNLDIDSYDRDVLDALLQDFRPRVVCAEINEKIPPPIKFSVVYDPAHVWAGDHFYGMSIAALAETAAAHGYAIAELHYNSAFLVPGTDGLSAEEAYRTGYLDRPDRLERFPWNADMESLHAMNRDEQLAFLRDRFAAYEGRYELGV